jgi:hypothetical protein
MERNGVASVPTVSEEDDVAEKIEENLMEP